MTLDLGRLRMLIDLHFGASDWLNKWLSGIGWITAHLAEQWLLKTQEPGIESSHWQFKMNFCLLLAVKKRQKIWKRDEEWRNF